MKTDPQLNHAAKRIVPHSLEKVITVFDLLGCKVVYRPPGGAKWAMVAQDAIPFRIQLVEVAEQPIITNTRMSSHIAFISNAPAEVVTKVESWAKEHSVKFYHGGWSERELWFDLPDLFIDFVVEIMHVSILDD